MNTIQTTRLLTATLVVGTLILFAPTGLSQNADEWTTDTVPTGGLVPTMIVAAHDAENVGVLWQATSTQDVGFSYFDGSTWALQTADISGAGTNYEVQDLEHITGDTWGALVLTGNGLDTVLWISTDNGETWTLTHTFSARDSGQLEVMGPATLAVSAQTASGTLLYFYKSTDTGASWTTGGTINGNQGSIIVADTQNIVVASGRQGLKATGNFLEAMFTGTSEVYYVYSLDGGDFWSVPYTTNGGSTPDPVANTCTGSVDNSAAAGQALIGQATTSMLWGETNTGSFVCSMTPPHRDTGTSVPVPASPPGSSKSYSTLAGQTNAGIIAADGNLDDQYLIGMTDIASTDTEIYYRSGTSGSFSLVHTIAATTGNVIAIEMTPTYGYVIYLNNQAGGQMFVDRALAFIADDGELTEWCSNPAVEDFGGDPDADFGFNYIEQVVFFDDPDEFGDPVAAVGSDLEDGYEFSSESDNYAFAGKGWQGNQATKSVFRIEADQEGRDSSFRSAFSFSFGDRIPSSTTTGSGTTAGDTSGAFEEHIQARFVENGNDWQISLRFNRDSSDDGSPDQIGATVSTGSPNTPTTYWFIVDTRGDGYAAIQTDQGVDLLNQTMAGHSNPLFAGFQGQTMYSHWYVTGGSNTILNSYTALDDNLDSGQTDDSSCLFFLDGPVIIEGDLGTVPGSLVPDEPGGGDGGGFSELFDPDNIDAQLFIGFLLVAGMVFMGIRQGGGQAVIGALFFVGLFLAYSLGWMPLWVILVIFTISLAAIFVLPQQSKDGV